MTPFQQDVFWIAWGLTLAWIGLRAIPLVSLEVRRWVHRYDPVYGPPHRVVKTVAEVGGHAFRFHISYGNGVR